MRTVALRGGLGNQLFGLAFAHSLRRLGGGPVGIACQASKTPPPFDIAAVAERLGLEMVAPGSAAPGPIIREGSPPAHRDGLRALAARGRHFVGYWQHPVYIAEIEVVRRAIAEGLRKRLPAALVCDVAIHYRTYADEPLPWRRGVPPPAYFAKALARLGTSGAAPVLVSDHPDLARRRLGGTGRATVAEGSLAEHLAILLNARQLILANSSFSWWAGVCGAAERTIYPRRRGCFHYPAPAPQFELI